MTTNTNDNIPSLLNTFVKGVKEKHEGVSLTMKHRGGSLVEIELISVPKRMRGQGIATDMMNSITAFADEHNLDVKVMPTWDFGADLPRLIKFYVKCGFRPISKASMLREANPAPMEYNEEV